MDLNEVVRRMMMAGLGAVSFTVEKSRELAELLVKKGEATAADSGVSCEKLCEQLAGQLRDFSEKVKADIDKASFEELLSRVDELTDDQRAALLERLTQPRPEPAPQEDGTCEPDATCGCAGEADEAEPEAPAQEDGADKGE